MNESWMQKWEEQKDVLVCPTDLESYFTSEEILSQKMEVMEIGNVSLPSGKVIVRDPLVYLKAGEKPYFVETPKGDFPVKIAVIKSEEWGDRYAVAKVQFTDEKPVVYREALLGKEDIEEVGEGDYFGFAVAAGLACITDVAVLPAFDKFLTETNADNIYDDYFAALFAQSYKNHPNNQRELGDWINWTIPNTSYHIPIFASGFGNGAYPVYFAYDAQDQICGLYIQFIDIELALSDDDEEEYEEDGEDDNNEPENFVFLKD